MSFSLPLKPPLFYIYIYIFISSFLSFYSFFFRGEVLVGKEKGAACVIDLAMH